MRIPIQDPPPMLFSEVPSATPFACASILATFSAFFAAFFAFFATFFAFNSANSFSISAIFCCFATFLLLSIYCLCFSANCTFGTSGSSQSRLRESESTGATQAGIQSRPFSDLTRQLILAV